MMQETDDPRDFDAPEAYVEEGETAVIDPRRSVFVHGMQCCVVEKGEGEEYGIALQLAGIVGGDGQEVSVTYLATIDAIAAIVAQLMATTAATPEVSETFSRVLGEEIQKLAEADIEEEDD